MIISPIKMTLPSYLPVSNGKKLGDRKIKTDIIAISFKGSLTYGKLPEEFNIDIANISDFTPGVLNVNDSGYLAQIFKYRPLGSQKIYAIKKVWPEHLAKHITANPTEQLKTEAQVFEKLAGLSNIPQFYFYNGDFAGTPEALHNNYIVMEWVDGKSASSDGTFYDLSLISKEKLSKIYNLLFEFDKKGVLHNDLWAGNILFTEKDVNLIDFNRSILFNPIENPRMNNLDSFKERFLSRYQSDVYQKLGEEALIDSYKYTTKLEAELLKRKAAFFSSKGLKSEAEELIKRSDTLGKSTSDETTMRHNALNEVFTNDLRCGKIYAKYFEFETGESLECYGRLKKLLSKDNKIQNINIANINTNIKVIKLLKQAIDLTKEGHTCKSLQLFKYIREKLNDQNAYPPNEREEIYYKKFSKFCDINIEILSSITANDKNKAKTILENNKDFFYQTKRIIPYYEGLNLILK